MSACGDDTTTRSQSSSTQGKTTETRASSGEKLDQGSLFPSQLYEIRDTQHDEILPEKLLPTPLGDKDFAFSKSLVSEDRRVAYNAAISALELNPQHTFENQELVVGVVAEMIHLTGMRNVYVISHNSNVRNQIKAFCRSQGYVFNGANNAAEALKELRQNAARDLILIDSGLEVTDEKGTGSSGASFPSITTIREGDRDLPRNSLFARELFLMLRGDVRTAHIHVALLASPEGSPAEVSLETAKTIYGDQAAGILAKPLDNGALKDLCQGLFHREDSLAQDAKLEAETMAVRACKAVAALNGKSTRFDLSGLSTSLIEAFREPVEGEVVRVAHLREAAIRAMQTVADPEAFKSLVQVASNPSNPDEVRDAAMDCLGTLLEKSGGHVESASRNEFITSMSDRLKEDSDTVWSSAASALGRIRLTPKERRDLAIEHRLNKARKN